MADTDGNWLPDSARNRLARYDAAGLKTSLLPVAGAVGIESVGLSPVGEVMGCIVQYVGWVGGYGSYGASYGGFYQSSVSFQPYVDALYHGYNTALARMLTEARAMGADGVVGIRLTQTRLGENNQEFVALGTAVRARSKSRPRSLFTTPLPGQDVAKLMHAGWVPSRLAIGIAVESRYLDWASASQLSVMAGNTEVSAYTLLITSVRSHARERLAAYAKKGNADGAIVSDMTLRSWHQEANNTRLLCAESAVFGTAIARFHAGKAAPTSALKIMPLRRRDDTR
ncbi:MAG TPA: heavy metal-binding domain-containing protein [Pseudonocardiaceae bacterium]|nr:heavy metal-binding domain-containing protein [Pseudonocardiaceae bacterium]